MGLIIGLLTSLPLGYVGEGGTRTIEIDVSEWLNRWPTAEIVVHVLRPDKYPYLPVTTVENGVLKWTVQRDEVAVRGRGKAFISAINKVTGDEYKSRVVQTIIAGTIEEFESVEAGDPAKGWVQQVLDARDEAVDAARRAENAAGSGGGGTGGGGTGVAVPSYWLTHLENRAADIREAMGKAGWNKSAFLFYSDTHWSYNYGSSPAIMHWLDQHTNVNKVFFGGDVVLAEGDDEVSMEYLWTWRSALHGLEHHSVPGNHDDGNSPDNRWEDPYVYSFLLAAEETPHVVRGDALYYYIDEPTEKTRYLFLDTATKDGNILNDPAEQAWLKETLISTPAGWHIVAVAHIWRIYNSDYSDAGFSSGGKICLDMFDDYNERTGDFANCEGRVEFCVGGHTHKDTDHVSDGGIPVILVQCDSRNVRDGSACTYGTITENSVNAIIADYLNGTISVIRIGRGISRVVKLDGSGSEEIPDSGADEETGPDIPTGNFTNVLTAAGWQDNMRFSLTTHEDVATTGWDITGYIPAGPGDTIYMANVTMMDINGETTGDARSLITFFDANKNFLTNSATFTPNSLPSEAWKAKYGDNGDVIQFTVPAEYNSNIVYLRIGAHDISKYSVITVNEPIYTGGTGSDYDMVAPTGNFTNVIKTALDADLTNVYNDGHGYKNDTRFSSSSMTETAATGWDTTGYFPLKIGDTLRFHNIEYADLANTGGSTKRNTVWLFNEDLSKCTQTPFPVTDTWNPVYNEAGDVIQMTVPSSYGAIYKWGRVCAKNITGASIITVNEEIDV